jgi:hypothetical protein
MSLLATIDDINAQRGTNAQQHGKRKPGKAVPRPLGWLILFRHVQVIHNCQPTAPALPTAKGGSQLVVQVLESQHRGFLPGVLSTNMALSVSE